MKRFVICVLVCALMISVAGCTSGDSVSCYTDSGGSNDLMDGLEPQQIHTVLMIEFDGVPDYMDLSVRLLQECGGEGNTLISPFSVMCALAMTANGADGETKAQMERVLGGYAWEINTWINGRITRYREELHLANAIWFTDDDNFTVNPDFLQLNADYYGAGIYSAPFDGSTLKDINNWVEENTDGMIPEILDQINPDAVMYLVNALAFEAKWQTVYTDNQVRDGKFTLEDGSTRRVELMYSQESRYLENEIASGFMKDYKGGNFAFVALLPREGMTMVEFVDALDGEMLKQLLDSVEDTPVDTAIPGFEAEYSADMAEILKEMGMPLAFDPEKADFSGLGTSREGNISISRVLHKTFIRVDADGTRAAAATVVEPTYGAAPTEQERKTVVLDRPFLYMIVDTESGIPLFIGTLMDPGTAG